MKKKIITPGSTPQDGTIKQKETHQSEIKPEIFWILNENNAGESRENLEALPVYVMYRDNDLYATLMPKILENIKQLGRKIFVHVFPIGTPKEDIKTYLAQSNVRESLQNVGFLRDYTCYQQLPGEWYHFDEENNTKGYELGRLSNNIIRNSLLDKTLTTEKSKDKNILSVAAELAAVHNIMRKLIDKTGIPNNLYIVEKSLSDHWFNNPLFRDTAYYIVEKTKEIRDLQAENNRPEVERVIKKEKERLSALDRADLVKFLENNSLFNGTIDLWFNKDTLVNTIVSALQIKGMDDEKEQDKARSEIKSMRNNFLANKIKDDLKDIIPEEKIKIVPDAYGVESGDDNYVLIDGHASYNCTLQRNILTNAVQIPVDIDAMLGYVVEKDLLTIDFVTDETIKQEIEKVFGPSKVSPEVSSKVSPEA